MRSSPELFEEYLQVKVKGAPSPYPPLNSESDPTGLLRAVVNSGYRLISQITRTPEYPLSDAYIGIIDDPRLNAMAFIHEGKDFIGINMGGIFILHDFFNRILAHPELFLGIGDITKENIPPQVFDYHIRNLDDLDPNEVTYPNDRDRQMLAQYLTLTACNFSIMHEYAHLVFGHVQVFGKYKSNSPMSEFETPENVEVSGISGMIRQTLEADADAYGVTIGMRHVMNSINFYKGNPSTPPPSYFASVEAGIYFWTFAVYLLWRLYGGEGFNIHTLENLDYPPPGVRIHYIMATIATLFLENSEEGIGASFAIQAMVSCEKALDKISYREVDKQALSQPYLEATQAHSLKIMHYWKHVRPLLEPYSRGPLAPLPE